MAFAHEGGKETGKGGIVTLSIDGIPVGSGRIEKTSPFKYSPSENQDVGSDTGTPVTEDYADKMPFKFTGELKRFVVVLQPQKLSEEEHKRLHEELAKAMMAVQ